MTVQNNTINVEYFASTTGGLSMNRVVAAATTNATVVKASAGQLYAFQFTNVAAYAVFVKFYNKATAPTVGTDVPVLTVGVPAGGTVATSIAQGVAFSLGIGLAITKLAPDADVTALIAGDAIANVLYA